MIGNARSATQPIRAFSTLGCPECTLPEAGELAARFGIDHLELRVLAQQLDLPEYLAKVFGDGWCGVRDWLATKRLRVPVIGSSFQLVEHEPSARLELLEYCRLAAALDTPYVRIFGGGPWGVGADLRDADFAQAVETLRWWETERERKNWKLELVVETHGAFSASAPCLRLIEAFGRSVNILWDAHHTWRFGNEDPATTWGQLRPFTRHIHLKDSLTCQSVETSCKYVLPAQGEMPAKDVLRLLKESNYGGVISLSKWTEVL